MIYRSVDSSLLSTAACACDPNSCVLEITFVYHYVFCQICFEGNVIKLCRVEVELMVGIQNSGL